MKYLNIKIREILLLAIKLDRSVKLSLQIIFDTFCIWVAFAGAMFLRLETFNFLYQKGFFISFAIILIPTLFIFAKIGLYRAFIRYVSTEIAVLVGVGCFVSAVSMILVKLLLAPFIPWSSPIIFSTLLFILITGSRFTMRSIFRSTKEKRYQHIAIYGAGAAGAQILHTLASSTKYRVQFLIDDNLNLQGRELYGHRILNFEEASKKFEIMNIDTILLAMTNVSTTARQNIISIIRNYKVKVKTIPPVATLIDDSTKITEFKDFAIEDLLGRERVAPLPKLLGKNINAKVVLVTGAGGSIGSELCRQIINLQPKQLLLLDISEIAIYTITTELEMQANKLGVNIIPLIGGVQDRRFISLVLETSKVDTIYHAAAYKHVPLMEKNVMQAIKNNTFGTFVLAEEAVRAKVVSFTLVSTDKAVNPTNVMGASKGLAEQICQALNTEQTVTRFSIVRFGNVLGSSGSVVPLFKKQIAAGGPITLTHPDVIRYFMTISEAVQLVIQASAMAKGGEVFVLDMGDPIKIKDLAFKMVQLSGLRPYLEVDAAESDGDIALRVIGLRPGEKMYEELSYADNLFGTIHPRIMTVNELAINPLDLRILINHLDTLITTQNHKGLIKHLTMAAGYKKRKGLKKKRVLGLPSDKLESSNNKIIPMRIKSNKN